MHPLVLVGLGLCVWEGSGLGVGLGLGNQAATSRESNEGVHNLAGCRIRHNTGTQSKIVRVWVIRLYDPIYD